MQKEETDDAKSAADEKVYTCEQENNKQGEPVP
jgi:hypothetical protein